MEGVPRFQAFSQLHSKPSLHSFTRLFYSAMNPIKLHSPLSLSKQTTNWGFIRLTLLLSFKNSKVSFQRNSPPLPLKQFHAARSLSAISYAACAPFKSTARQSSFPLPCLLSPTPVFVSNFLPYPFSLSCFSSSCLPASLKSPLRLSLSLLHPPPINLLR